MFQTITTIPDFRIHEYLLIISPTGELWHQLLSIKNEFAEKYKAWLAAYTKPHITLANFLAYAQREPKIIQRLETIGRGITPFNIAFKDFGAFESSSTIYVNVETKAPVQALVQELKIARQLLTPSREYRPIFVGDPHLSVCRKLNPWQYKMSWSEYSLRSFTGTFPANYMTLLKKAYGENNYETVEQFTFRSTPSLPLQGSLFV